MEAGICGANFSDPMPAHRGSNMRIVHDVAQEARKLRGEIPNHLRVAVGFDKPSERWRLHKAINEVPGGRE